MLARPLSLGTFVPPRSPQSASSFVCVLLPLRELHLDVGLLAVAEDEKIYLVAHVQVFQEVLDGMVAVELFAVQREDDILFLEARFFRGAVGNDGGIVFAFAHDERAVIHRQAHFFLQFVVDHHIAEAEERPADAAVFFDIVEVAPRGVHGDREADALRAGDDRGVHADDAAVASTSGPPELPGLIAASVWMRPRISCGGGVRLRLRG